MSNENPQQTQYLVVNVDKHEMAGIWFGLDVAIERAIAAASSSGQRHAVYKLVGNTQPVRKATWAPVDDQKGA